jgi:hypothetical protein
VSDAGKYYKDELICRPTGDEVSRDTQDSLSLRLM